MLTPLAAIDADAVLSLEDAKAQCHIVPEDTTWDDLIAAFRDAAVAWVEAETGKGLTEREYLWEDKQFVCAFRLPVRPVKSVSAVSYTDTAGDSVDLVSSDWLLAGGILQPAPTTRWPYALGSAGSVRITFTAGLADAATEAPGLVQAVRLLVGHWFANREAVNVGNIVNELQMAVQALCDQHRVPVL